MFSMLDGNDDNDNEIWEHGRFLDDNKEEDTKSDMPKRQIEEQIIKSICCEHSHGYFICYGDLTDKEREKINQVFAS
eukprot:8907424-Ditylum_brightwellii.AAC.1